MKSFVKNKDAVPAEAQAAAAQAEATATATSTKTTALANYTNSSYYEGETSQSDIKTPYLACVHGVGPKSAVFSPGTVLLGEATIFPAPSDPKTPTNRLRIMFCRTTKVYVENLPFNQTPGSPRPRIYRTQAEVLENGGTLEYRGNVAPSFIPKLTASILVRQPENNNDDQFCFIAGEKAYAPAMVSFQKSGYSAAKTFLTDMSLSLKNDPTGTFYDIFWSKELKGTNWVYVPKLVRVRDEKPTDDIKAIANKLAGSNVEAPEEDETV